MLGGPAGERGLTLVETLVSVAILGVVAAALSAFSVASFRLWRSGMDQATLVRDLVPAMERMEQDLRQARALVAISPGKIQFTDADGQAVAVDLAADGTVRRQPGLSGSGSAVLATGVTQLQFTPTGPYIQIHLTGMSPGGRSLNLDSGVLIRASGMVVGGGG